MQDRTVERCFELAHEALGRMRRGSVDDREKADAVTAVVYALEGVATQIRDAGSTGSEPPSQST